MSFGGAWAEMKRKIGFPLHVKDGWPPFDVEHIWVEADGRGYTVKNVPFFVRGIALDDVISADLDEHGYVLKWSQLTPSTNSTMWIIEHHASDLCEKLETLGCDVERGNPSNLISVNIPASIDVDRLDSVLEPREETGAISVAVPTDRLGLR
jgi:Domain of unknown function (DUF4265)